MSSPIRILGLKIKQASKLNYWRWHLHTVPHTASGCYPIFCFCRHLDWKKYRIPLYRIPHKLLKMTFAYHTAYRFWLLPNFLFLPPLRLKKILFVTFMFYFLPFLIQTFLHIRLWMCLHCQEGQQHGIQLPVTWWERTPPAVHLPWAAQRRSGGFLLRITLTRHARCRLWSSEK